MRCRGRGEVDQDRPHDNITRHMCFVFWITKANWLRERVSVLRYNYIACLVQYYLHGRKLRLLANLVQRETGLVKSRNM